MGKRLRFVDMFAGIGGIRLGLEQALHQHSIASECIFSCEIDTAAQETYQINFDRVQCRDIREVDKLPTHDILLAGFPCQAFSYAGKQKGFADTRGTLFFEIERLLGNLKKKPKYMLLENVRGFTTHDGGRTFKTVVSIIEGLGYKVNPLLLNSSNFNVPQNRVRAYLVCSLGKQPALTLKTNIGSPDSHKFKRARTQGDIFDKFNKHKMVVRDILEKKVDKKYYCSRKFTENLGRVLNGQGFNALNGVRLIDHRGGNSIHSWDIDLKGSCSKKERELMSAIIANRRKKHFGREQDGKRLTLEQIKTFHNYDDTEKALSSLLAKGYLSKKNGKYNPVAGNMSFEVFKFLDPDSISITVVSSDAHRLGVVANGLPRRITPRECARIQGFPDSFKLHSNDNFGYRQLGNSVSVPVIANIFSDLIECDKDFFGAF